MLTHVRQSLPDGDVHHQLVLVGDPGHAECAGAVVLPVDQHLQQREQKLLALGDEGAQGTTWSLLMLAVGHLQHDGEAAGRACFAEGTCLQHFLEHVLQLAPCRAFCQVPAISRMLSADSFLQESAHFANTAALCQYLQLDWY